MSSSGVWLIYFSGSDTILGRRRPGNKRYLGWLRLIRHYELATATAMKKSEPIFGLPAPALGQFSRCDENRRNEGTRFHGAMIGNNCIKPHTTVEASCSKSGADATSRRGPMRAAWILSVPIALGISSGGAGAAAQCTAYGAPIQWAADYCMLKMETDDEIAVADCLEEEIAKLIDDDCASKLHFKRNMCELMIRNGTRPGTVDQCVKDSTFKGRTVEAGGVGAQ